jgi:SAM-dependent methyltransferase
MLELGLPFEPLPVALDFPTHFPPESYTPLRDVEPLVLHYHSRIDASGFLLPTGQASVDAAVSQVNETIRTCRHADFDNRSFWDHRYACHAALGSGVESRGDVLRARRELLYPLVALFSEKEVLDVGCGDLEVMAEAEARRYTGLDLSREAIALARAKRPDWNFLNGTMAEVEGPLFDLVLCGCVLIHIPARDAYLDLVRRMVDACRDTLVIEAYNQPPSITSEITYYHEPIAETLRRDPRIGAVRTIGSYRDIEVVLAQRVEAIPVNAWQG